jgi:hypothetical protein
MACQVFREIVVERERRIGRSNMTAGHNSRLTDSHSVRLLTGIVVEIHRNTASSSSD